MTDTRITSDGRVNATASFAGHPARDIVPTPFLAPPGVAIPPVLALPAEDGTPHPLAAAALASLARRLRDEPSPAGFDLDGPDGGKMFGVLVVQPRDRERDDELGVLHAFSGRLGRAWLVDGFVPPVFDLDLVAGFWPTGEAEIDAMTAELATLQGEAHRELALRRRNHSRALWKRFIATYRIADAHGSMRPLADLFAPRVVPGGAGDCAAPKLLTRAFELGARPLALGEMWWGRTVGARREGTTWPPCADKCGPVLAHMLGAPVLGNPILVRER